MFYNKLCASHVWSCLPCAHAGSDAGMFRFGPTWEEALCMFDKDGLEAMLACFGMFCFGPTWEEAFCLFDFLKKSGSDAGMFTFLKRCSHVSACFALAQRGRRLCACLIKTV